VSRILVVEDYPPLATVIAISLRRLGHEVVRVGNVQRAEIAEGSFDAAVLDVDLPDGNGIELAGELADAGTVAGVVFFTATRDAEARARALRLGPVVDKSAGVEELARVVGETLIALNAKVVGGPDAVLNSRGRSGTRRKVR
jgi:DNA-binding response OmpR family regulator